MIRAAPAYQPKAGGNRASHGASLPSAGRGLRLALWFLAAASLTVGASCRGPVRNERRVVLYCSVDQTGAEPIVAEFERRSGIRVLARYDAEAGKTVGLVQRLRAEAASPSADVFWSGEVFHTIQLARDGLLDRYAGEQTRNWPARFADPRGRWYGFALRARVIAYNTRKVSPEEAPKRLEELLDAKWKGRIAMAYPRAGTTGGDVASWFAHYGAARARAILEALRDGGVRMAEGNSQAVRMVATGQADVCLTDSDDVYAAQRERFPVAMNYLDQGGDGVLAIPNTAVVKGSPNPEEAKALMEFLLSEEVERLLARSDSHNTPVRESLAREFPQYAIPRPLAVEYEKVADHLPEALRLSAEILP